MHCYLRQRSLTGYATENRSPTQGYFGVGGPERSGGTGGNVRPVPGPGSLLVTGGELAVDGGPIETLGQIESNEQNLQLRPSILFRPRWVCLICKSSYKPKVMSDFHSLYLSKFQQ